MGIEYFEDKNEYIFPTFLSRVTPRVALLVGVLGADEEITQNETTVEVIADLIFKGSIELSHPRRKLLGKG